MRPPALALRAALAVLVASTFCVPVLSDIKQTGASFTDKAFLSRYGGEADTVVLPSGMMYKSLREGTGGVPTSSTKCACHYEGRTAPNYPSGATFDSSYKRGVPTTFAPNQVIPCWTEAMEMMHVGSKRELVCPPEIAYGGKAMGTRIPAWSVLTFTIEIISCVGLRPSDGKESKYTLRALAAWFGPWPGYVIGIIVVALVVFNAAKLPFVLCAAHRKVGVVGPFLRPGFATVEPCSSTWLLVHTSIALLIDFLFICTLFGGLTVATSALPLAALSIVHLICVVINGLFSEERSFSLGGAAVTTVGLFGNLFFKSTLVFIIIVMIFNALAVADAANACAVLGGCAKASKEGRMGGGLSAVPPTAAEEEEEEEEDSSE